jgi:tRNA-specific 2-thiouridylase
VGPLAGATGVGASGSVSCGDLVHIQLRLEGRHIAAARFQAYGCPATIAGASELVARVEGADLLDAAAISEESIADVLQLSPQKRACSNIAVDALHQALEDALRGVDTASADPDVALDPRGVVVGMSGGVDSTVAALELVRQGYRVIGVTFRLWSDPVCATGRSCCSPEAIVAARRAAHGLGLPHLTIDLSERFCTEVVDYFVDEYRRARTPNPCVRCNAVLRFGALAAVADALGAAWIATGHYARLTGERAQLTRGVDDHKDQSYVLAQVPPPLLRRALFPLGGFHNTQTRALAREAGFEVHDNPDSQEICFIPDDDYRRFLRARVDAVDGDIVDTEGRVRGRHAGLHNFTIGQRRGLGIAGAEPLYVVALLPETQQVVVGPAAATEVHEVRVSGVVNHTAAHDGAVPAVLTAQVRSTGGAVGVECQPAGDGLVLRLTEAVRGVAPGQTAVVYAGEQVLCAGTIDDTA